MDENVIQFSRSEAHDLKVLWKDIHARAEKAFAKHARAADADGMFAARQARELAAGRLKVLEKQG
jgi:hypothetical protein